MQNNRSIEQKRLDVLKSISALGLRSDASFEAIAAAAAAILDAPVAMLTLVEADRVVFLACHGVERSDMPRLSAFCAETVLSDGVLVIPDMAADSRFAHRIVTDDAPFMRSYAGAPLVTPEGARLGTLCILDSKPRPALASHERRALETLAGLAMDQIMFRREESLAATMLDVTKDEIRPMLAINAAGYIEYANLAAARLLGRSQESLRKRAFDAVVVPGPLNAGCETLISVYARSDDQHEAKALQRVALLADGSERSVEISVRPWRAADGAGMVVFMRRSTDALANGDVVSFPRSLAGRNTQAEIARGLEHGEFQLYYQPQVTMPDGEAFAVEALVRWDNPERGMMLPQTFLIDVEENGFALPLGWWILDRACEQLAAWRARGIGLRRVGVNLFTAQYRSEALVQRVEKALSANNLAPEMLELEVTETIALLNDELGLSSLRRLADIGVRIAFDDFGTGYASLSSLQQFPLTTLKLDQCFIRDIEKNASDAIIAKSMIGLARELGLESIAEGIETIEQHQIIADMGCRSGQGFLYGRPVAANRLPEALAMSRAFLQAQRAGIA